MKPVPDEVKVTVTLPRGVYIAMKHQAVEEGTTVRDIVLRGLQKTGFDVLEGDLGDRRKA